MKKWSYLLIVLIFFITNNNIAQTLYPNYEENPSYSQDALHRLYIVGLQYLNSGEISQAEIAFRSIIAFPYRSKDWRTTRYYKGKAHLYLGDIYFVQKKYKESAQNYQLVAQEYGEIEEYSVAIYKLGRSLILDKQESTGIEVLQNYNFNYGTKDRLADNTMYWIAQGYIGLENYNTALKMLHQILRDFPNSGMAYDIRILITKLETELASPSINNNSKNTVANIKQNNQSKTELIAKEKELADRMQEMLILKENLLELKEKKLSLLESLAASRASMLKDKKIALTN